MYKQLTVKELFQGQISYKQETMTSHEPVVLSPAHEDSPLNHRTRQ